MDALKEFSIPFQGLKNGIYQFEYLINSSFFDNFEDTALTDVELNVFLKLEREVNMLVLNFEFTGIMVTECDRCLEIIDMPVKGTQQLMVKFSEEKKEEEDDVTYIHPKAPELNVAKYIYELAHLSVPFRKVKPECEKNPQDCPTNFLDKINVEKKNNEPNEDEAGQIPKESVWSILNKFKN